MESGRRTRQGVLHAQKAWIGERYSSFIFSYPLLRNFEESQKDIAATEATQRRSQEKNRSSSKESSTHDEVSFFLYFRLLQN